MSERTDGECGTGSGSIEATSIAGYLERNGTLTYTNVGTSMMPLLKQGRDLFTVRAKKPGERLSVGDVAIYRRGKSTVLHRVVEVTDSGYVMLGDNCVRREYGISEGDVIGVMTGYVRRGKAHSVTEPAYLRYTSRILRNEQLRVGRKKLAAMIRSAGGRALRALTGGKKKS